MKVLFDEILLRFPELAEEKPELVEEGDEGEGKHFYEELPFLVMGYLVDWLDSMGEGEFDRTLVQRVADFAKWCELQPRGETASDDIFSILAVGLYENLFLHDRTMALIPHLLSKADLQANEQYLVSWIGRDNYDKVMEQFQRAVG